MFLPEVIVHIPRDALRGLDSKAEELIFQIVKGLRLLRSIHEPVVDGYGIRDSIVGLHPHVVEGQEIEPVRTRVVMSS